MTAFSFFGWLLPALAVTFFGYKLVTWLFIKPEVTRRFEDKVRSFEVKRK